MNESAMKMRIGYLFTFMIAVITLSCSRNNDQADSGQMTSIPVGQPQTALSAASENTPAETVTLGAVINENGWYTDWNAGITAAQSQNRPVIIDFYTDWCSWCKTMDEKTFSDPGIKKKFADGWIMIKVNAENKNGKGSFRGVSLTYPELALRFGITGYPSYGFLDKKGEPVNVLVGYREVPQFTVILDYYQQEIYKLSEKDQQKFIDSSGAFQTQEKP